MNKKGIIYSIGIVFITLVVLLTAFTYYFSEKSGDDLGDSNTIIFKTYQEAQRDLVNYDVKAKSSAIDSLYHLAANSGFNKEDSCGSYYDVALLSYKNEEKDYVECIPNLEEEYENEFKENFQKTLTKENQNNHEYFAKKINNFFQISGFALKNKEIQIGKEENKRKLSYKPSFTDKINYNFTIYDLIPKFLDDVNENCKGKENNKNEKNELDDCVDEQVKKFNKYNKNRDVEIKQNAGVFKDKKESLFQDFSTLDESNFESCYYQVNKRYYYPKYDSDILNLIFRPADTKTELFFSNISKGEPINSKHHVINYELFWGKKEKDFIIQEDADMTTYSYEYEESVLKKISRSEKNVATFNLFKCNLENPNVLCFIDDETYKNNEEFILNRPCELENRKYSFIIKDKEIYPDKGELEYKFSIYVKDVVKPEIETLTVKDKEFDEDTSLVVWDHSLSYDITKYEVYLNGDLKKTIVPWKFVNVYNELDWKFGKSQKTFDSCMLNTDGEYTQCYYSFNGGEGQLEDNQTYYFSKTGEFVYVLKFKEDEKDFFNNVKVIAYDDDGNAAYLGVMALYPKDTLPYAPITQYVITPGLESATSTEYTSINYVGVESLLEDASLINNIISEIPLNIDFIQNIDGSISNSLPTSRLLYHQVGTLPSINEKTDSSQLIGLTINLGNVYSLTIPATFLPVYDDPSLKNIKNINLDLFGYQEQSIPLPKLISE